jgi:hypothetical protein
MQMRWSHIKTRRQPRRSSNLSAPNAILIQGNRGFIFIGSEETEMLESSKQSMHAIASMLENDILGDDVKDMLGQSLFYYCSGIDPTPIAAFGAKIPLYIYVDSLVSMKNDFSAEVQELYGRLENLNFHLAETHTLNSTGRLQKTRNTELTLWKTLSGESFLLLFVQDDAIRGFESIYQDSANYINYIQPKYICNYRYELVNLGILTQIEKRVEYILGYCFNQKYRCVEEYDYYGDYSFDSACKMKVKLYHRFFYYLF